MSYEIKNLSAHKKELKTGKMKVTAILHVSDDLMPNDDTLAEIEAVATDERIFHHVVALSDVHSKKGRKNPTGTAVASENYLLPQINDTAPNCGMRLLKTNLTDADLSPENIEKLFNELVEVIPTKKYIGTKIPYSLVMDICRKGVSPVKEFFKTRTKNEIENSFKQGNFFNCHSERSVSGAEESNPSKEIRSLDCARDDNFYIPSEQSILNAIPKLFLRIGQYRLGILGAAGNHFLDLMKISEIKDAEIAQKFGIRAGQYVFLLHTGSGLLGQYSSYMYTPKKKEHLSQWLVLQLGKLTFGSRFKNIYKNLAIAIEKSKNRDKYFGYDDVTPEGKMFLTAHNASANNGFANRVILTHHLDQAIEKVLGKNPELELLYDMPHVYINQEKHFGRDVWMHRNGTVRANGPSRMKHPVFSETGEPVFIPSSMSTPAYIGVGTDENESTFFSASHGTGRRKDPEKGTPENKDALFARMNAKHVKLFNARSKGVIMQDSAYYKDVEEVISGMVDNKIIKVVAKMEPVAVLMY